MSSTSWILVFMLVNLGVNEPQYFEYEFETKQACEEQAVAVLYDPWNPIDWVQCREVTDLKRNNI